MAKLNIQELIKQSFNKRVLIQEQEGEEKTQGPLAKDDETISDPAKEEEEKPEEKVQGPLEKEDKSQPGESEQDKDIIDSLDVSEKEDENEEVEPSDAMTETIMFGVAAQKYLNTRRLNSVKHK